MTQKLLLFFFLTFSCIGCNFTLDHTGEVDFNVNVSIGIDEACLVCFASCDDGENYSCESPTDEIDCSNCAPGCLGGVGAGCNPDGSMLCYTEISNIELQVPAICVQRSFIPGEILPE